MNRLQQFVDDNNFGNHQMLESFHSKSRLDVGKFAQAQTVNKNMIQDIVSTSNLSLNTQSNNDIRNT